MKPTRIWRFEGENLILQVTDLGSLRDQGARIAQDIQAAGLKDAITSKWKLEKNHEIAKYPMFTALFEQPRASATDAGENAHKRNVGIPFDLSNKRNPLGYVSSPSNVVALRDDN